MTEFLLAYTAWAKASRALAAANRSTTRYEYNGLRRSEQEAWLRVHAAARAVNWPGF